MEKKSIHEIVSVIFKAVTLAMGAAVVVLSCMGALEGQTAVTLLGILTGFSRTNILVFVTIMLLLLCAVQLYKLRHSFRTIRSFKGMRKRHSGDAAQAE